MQRDSRIMEKIQKSCLTIKSVLGLGCAGDLKYE